MNTLAPGALSSAALILTLTGCASSTTTEIALERWAPAKLDVSPFQRVLVPGFVVAGTREIDINEETVRLLRGQLHRDSSLKVIDTGAVLPLTEIGRSLWTRPPAEPETATSRGPAIRERDLPRYAALFADAAYWKRLAEEYPGAIIITGTLVFTVQTGSFVDGHDAVRPRVVNRTVCALRSEFIFIDGRSGALLDTETFEEALTHGRDTIPALSSYFQLMDRVLPGVVATVSPHTFPSYRTLLK